MNIEYKTIKELPCGQLSELFDAVGWSDDSGEMTPAMLANFNKPFINSTFVFSAWDNDKLVGCIRALSDKIFRSVIFDLAVLPRYQKCGIGSSLLKKCIESCPDSEWTLGTIPKRISFYSRFGFEVHNGLYIRKPCKWF